MKLRPSVKFHDGTPFGAKDVKASFERVLNPENKLTARGNHAKIKSVEVVDDLTVRFKTDGPYPVFVERLTALVMQSEKVMKEKGHEWMQDNPVGTGPYKLVKWNKKQEHLLVRNDDYWGPKPAFKYVRVRIIPEQATQIAELVSGGVDIIKAVPPDQMDVINKSGQARTTTSPILRTAMIQLDQAGRSGPNPIQDKRVRQAANLAVDIDGDHQARAQRPGRPHRHHREPDGLRLRSQREALQAGPGPGQEAAGRRRVPERARGRLPAHAADVEPGLIQTSDAIVADLAKAGIRTKARMVGEVGPFTNLIRDNKADPMFEFSWGYYSIFDADAIFFDVMTCNQPYSYYCNKALDDLVIQGRSTLDTKRRMEIYAKAQKLIHDDAAYLFKWGLRGVWGVSNRIDYEAPARRGRSDVGRDAPEEVGATETGPGVIPGPGSPAAMRRYIARQVVQLVVVILGISLLAFGILHVLGDPVLLLLPQNAGKEEFERYRHLLGLDRPLYVQYWKFVSRAVLGDFGKSWYADTPAFKLVIERMPPTIYLTLCGLVVALLIALPLGTLAALRRHSWIDNLCTAVAVAGQAAPLFWLGIMMIIVFSVRLRWLPASGYDSWQNFLMPSFCLGAALAPITMRLVRSGVIEVMSMEFIKTARAKGLAESRVVGQARLPQRVHPGDHRAGAAVRPAPGRRHHHRDGVRVARRGHPHRGVDPQPGLPGGPVRGGAPGAAHRGGQPDRRHHRGVHRPPHSRLLTPR